MIGPFLSFLLVVVLASILSLGVASLRLGDGRIMTATTDGAPRRVCGLSGLALSRPVTLPVVYVLVPSPAASSPAPDVSGLQAPE